MKILITVGIYPPDIGGPASFVPKIANLLSQNNYEVTAFDRYNTNNDWGWLENSKFKSMVSN